LRIKEQETRLTLQEHDDDDDDDDDVRQNVNGKPNQEDTIKDRGRIKSYRNGK